VRKIDICEAGFKLALKDFARDRGEGFSGAGATFDWLFFDNSKVINFDD
jgi:hypothetical protein